MPKPDDAPELYTIGELSEAFGLSPRAIRLYEDQGLIKPGRAGAQRVYTRRDRARLRLILRGKRLGFTLADIKRLLDLYDADRTQTRQLAATLERVRARISELEQQLDDLQVTLAELRDIEAEIVAYQAAVPAAKPAAPPGAGARSRPHGPVS